MAGPYREYAPHPALARYVSCYWSASVDGATQHPHPVLPDGCIDLLFEEHTQSLSVVGTMSRALWVEPCGPTSWVGIRFRSGGSRPLLRDDAHLLTDQLCRAVDVLGRGTTDLNDKLVGAATASDRLTALEAYLLARVSGWEGVDRRVAYFTAALLHAPSTPIEGLAAELGTSRQHVRRLFLHHTGLSPKTFARVARLSQLVDAMGSNTSLCNMALDAGYSDQAHMTREFRALVGLPPARYRAYLAGVPFVQDDRDARV